MYCITTHLDNGMVMAFRCQSTWGTSLEVFTVVDATETKEAHIVWQSLRDQNIETFTYYRSYKGYEDIVKFIAELRTTGVARYHYVTWTVQ